MLETIIKSSVILLAVAAAVFASLWILGISPAEELQEGFIKILGVVGVFALAAVVISLVSKSKK